MTNPRWSCVAAGLLLAACGSKDPAPTTPDAPATPVATEAKPAEPVAGGEDPAVGCAALFVRLRECTAEFIPALVSWRVELDVPAGIAEVDQNEGRDALVSTAMAEWEQDSTDEAITAMCGQIVASIPPEQLDRMLATGRECVAKDTCPDVVTCIGPMQRARLQAQKDAEGS